MGSPLRIGTCGTFRLLGGADDTLCVVLIIVGRCTPGRPAPLLA
jgi:hypothetical protein